MAQLNVEQAFQEALQYHQAQQLSRAEQLYRTILAQQPNHADSLHLLGVIAASAGRHDSAVELIRRAVSISPNFSEAHGNLANALAQQGQIDEAVAEYRRALYLKPNCPDVYINLAKTLQRRDRFQEAIAALQTASSLKPDSTLAHFVLANALLDAGRFDEAILAFRNAIALKPDFPDAFNNLGNALKSQGLLDDAIAAYRHAIRLSATYPHAWNNLGVALQLRAQLDEAIAACREAIARLPTYAEAYSNLGNILREKGDLTGSLEALRQAIALKPACCEAHINLGVSLKSNGQLKEAADAYHRAVALNPDSADAHHNYALSLLGRGEFARGWNEFEWRWKCRDFPSPVRNFNQPLWDGRPLGGARILVHAEQGFGDTIQFIRYVPMVIARGGNVIIECQIGLEQLLRTIAGNCQIVSHGQPLPDFATHCPLMRLPLLFETTSETIPAQIPYLHAASEKREQWKSRIGCDSDALKVGLAWAGNKLHGNDRNRSIPFSTIAPILNVDGTRFHSLQKDSRPGDLDSMPAKSLVVDWSDMLHDFSDTAALIANLDAVICVDTAVAHLAGAMGKNVWVLLPFVSDWRWQSEREDSPWYPTMRLFRQPRIGDWESVVANVAAELSRVIGKAH